MIVNAAEIKRSEFLSMLLFSQTTNKQRKKQKKETNFGSIKLVIKFICVERPPAYNNLVCSVAKVVFVNKFNLKIMNL